METSVEDFSRYLDLSYYNWSIYEPLSSEIILRFGMGKSFSYKRFTLGLIPYMGGRYLPDREFSEFREDFGLKTSSLITLSSKLKIKSSLTHYIRSPFSFAQIWDVNILFSIQSQGIFFSFSGTERHSDFSIGLFQQL